MGIGNTSQQAFFARKPDRDFDAKKQGVYHLALLANLCFALFGFRKQRLNQST